MAWLSPLDSFVVKPINRSHQGAVVVDAQYPYLKLSYLISIHFVFHIKSTMKITERFGTIFSHSKLWT